MSFTRRIFPQRVYAPPHIQQLLERLYPTIDWKNVAFYEGLPWFLSSWVSAIVLPDEWGTSRVNVYFKKFNPNTPYGISVIVHEAFHLLQAFDIEKGYGVGLARGFLIYYIGLYFKTWIKGIGKYAWWELGSKAYYKHPMELPAYAIQRNFFDSWTYHEGANAPSPLNPSDFIQKNPSLIQVNSRVSDEFPLFWLILGGIFVGMGAILFPFSIILLRIILYIPYIYMKKI